MELTSTCASWPGFQARWANASAKQPGCLGYLSLKYLSLQARSTKFWKLFSKRELFGTRLFVRKFVRQPCSSKISGLFRSFPLVSVFVVGVSAFVWPSKTHSAHATPGNKCQPTSGKMPSRQSTCFFLESHRDIVFVETGANVQRKTIVARRKQRATKEHIHDPVTTTQGPPERGGPVEWRSAKWPFAQFHASLAMAIFQLTLGAGCFRAYLERFGSGGFQWSECSDASCPLSTGGPNPSDVSLYSKNLLF